MALRQFLKQVIMSLLLVNGLLTGPLNAAMVINYASPLGDEHWRMTGNRLRCGLSLTIPDYGVAYFEQYAARPPHFILSKWEQVEKQLSATVFAKEPMWKPRAESFFITKTLVSPGEYAIYMPRDPALKALTYLARGYQTKIEYKSEQGFLVSVAISPVRFQKVYSKYQRCLGSLLPFTFASIRTSVLLFESESDELNDLEKQTLDRVIMYIRADPAIKKVRIAGYTDDRGRKSYNNAISQARAEAVEKYLLQAGIRKSLIYTTWFGLLDPVAPNNSEAGMAKNRRVVVEIKK